jgi:hypothetical protein
MLEKKTGLSAYIQPLSRESDPYLRQQYLLALSEPKTVSYRVNTPSGFSEICCSELPNDFCSKRTIFRKFLESPTSDIHRGSIYGFIAEAMAYDIFSGLLDKFEIAQLPDDLDRSDYNNRGGDLVVLNQVDEDSYEPLVLLDVTTKSASGIRRKYPGVNQKLGAPVVVFPMGDLYKQTDEDKRIKHHFEDVVIPSLMDGSYSPFIGVSDNEQFLERVLCHLDASIDNSSSYLFKNLYRQKSFERVTNWELSIKKLSVFGRYLDDLRDSGLSR